MLATSLLLQKFKPFEGFSSVHQSPHAFKHPLITMLFFLLHGCLAGEIHVYSLRLLSVYA